MERRPPEKLSEKGSDKKNIYGKHILNNRDPIRHVFQLCCSCLCSCLSLSVFFFPRSPEECWAVGFGGFNKELFIVFTCHTCSLFYFKFFCQVVWAALFSGGVSVGSH